MEYGKNQHKSADNLGENVGGIAPDLGTGAEYGELGALVLCYIDMPSEKKVDYRCTEKSADKLCDNITWHERPAEHSRKCKSQGNGRIYVSTGIGSSNYNSDENSQSPPNGNNHPACPVAFGIFQHRIGNHPVSHQNQSGSTYELIQVNSIHKDL